MMIMVNTTNSLRMYPSLNPSTMKYEGAFRPQGSYQGESAYADVAQLTGSELNIQEGEAMDIAGFEQMPDPKYFGACEGCADSEIFERPNAFSKKKNSAPPLPDLRDALEDEKKNDDDPQKYQRLLRQGDRQNDRPVDPLPMPKKPKI